MRGDGAATRPYLFFEDFRPGQVFELGTRVLSVEEIIAFAGEWDPQSFHLDPLAAAEGPFGGLIASGWQTACVWMRMYVDEVLSRASMLAAPGVEELRWLAPVRPGMQIRGRATVIEAWPSKGSPGRGTLRLRGELFDEQRAAVMTMLARGHARVRQVEKEER
jgi:acyl dehydratase